MWTVLTRIGLAVAALVVWLSLIAASIALTFHGVVVALLGLLLIMLTMAYIVVVPLLLITVGRVRDIDSPVGTVLFGISFASGFVVAFLGMVTALGFNSWYLNHYGVDTSVRVVEADCRGPVRAGECEQDLRVVVATTGVDLGWVGCNGTGYWPVGEVIDVRSDPRGLVPPSVSNCPPEGFLDTVVPLTLILAVVTVTASAAAPAFRRRLTSVEGPVEDEVRVPVDTPGWRPPADR